MTTKQFANVAVDLLRREKKKREKPFHAEETESSRAPMGQETGESALGRPKSFLLAHRWIPCACTAAARHSSAVRRRVPSCLLHSSRPGGGMPRPRTVGSSLCPPHSSRPGAGIPQPRTVGSYPSSVSRCQAVARWHAGLADLHDLQLLLRLLHQLCARVARQQEYRITGSSTSTASNDGWLAKYDLNKDRLDLFYWLNG
jgi:hypothetical protein